MNKHIGPPRQSYLWWGRRHLSAGPPSQSACHRSLGLVASIFRDITSSYASRCLMWPQMIYKWLIRTKSCCSSRKYLWWPDWLTCNFRTASLPAIPHTRLFYEYLLPFVSTSSYRLSLGWVWKPRACFTSGKKFKRKGLWWSISGKCHACQHRGAVKSPSAHVMVAEHVLSVARCGQEGPTWWHFQHIPHCNILDCNLWYFQQIAETSVEPTSTRSLLWNYQRKEIGNDGK